jgi:phage/plasmid-like protein (TIGR03299 family)
MSAEVETMFYVRETPWHGLGTRVAELLSSKEALVAAGLNWNVVQKELYTEDGSPVQGFYANVRDSDEKVLGVVSNRYRIVQNREAFAFTDELLGKGVTYETAGSLREGRKTWILAKLPKTYRLAEDKVTPYLVFSNTHDGSGAIKVAMTPVRVVCNNTLNLALQGADRIWSANHTGNMESKLEDARMTLFMAENYMNELSKEADKLSRRMVSDDEAEEYIRLLLPIATDATETMERNVRKLRADLRKRYYLAPDLKEVGKNGYRFINAVSDFATHAKPLRETANYRENLFLKTMEGNPLIDKAYQLLAV